MTKDDIVKKFPSMFRASGNVITFGGFSCGPGWLPLIHITCCMVDFDREKAVNAIERQKDPVIAKTLQQEYDNTTWPKVSQIKEKYGTLRFYADYTTEIDNAYIDFAETMSGSICEECGAPGIQTGGGWIKTVCDEHKKTD